MKQLEGLARLESILTDPAKFAGANEDPSQTKLTFGKPEKTGGSTGGAAEAAGGKLAAVSTAVVAELPTPGKEGFRPGALAGHVVCATGVFSDAGGLSAGKDDLSKVVERFGGRVVSAVSKKVTILVVGAAPGAPEPPERHTHARTHTLTHSFRARRRHQGRRRPQERRPAHPPRGAH